ncbi:hypothetical protein PtB15_5B117 [Puccinia triticina]|nr:hypothetical protein PtB15_5B117 [Puccinia triticina]
MRSTTVTLFLALSLHAVMATQHTQCYEFFMWKDKCVWSAAATNQRCPVPPKDHEAPVKTFAIPPTAAPSRLERRYDTTRGICGFYNSTTEAGVCLWSGPEQKDPTLKTAGWLNSQKTSNCGKRVYIQRKGKPETVQYVKVLDGCSFKTKHRIPGCFDIAVTIDLFNRFNPTAEEKASGLLLNGLSWDFDNINNDNTQQAPV